MAPNPVTEHNEALDRAAHAARCSSEHVASYLGIAAEWRMMAEYQLDKERIDLIKERNAMIATLLEHHVAPELIKDLIQTLNNPGDTA